MKVLKSIAILFLSMAFFACGAGDGGDEYQSILGLFDEPVGDLTVSMPSDDVILGTQSIVNGMIESSEPNAHDLNPKDIVKSNLLKVMGLAAKDTGSFKCEAVSENVFKCTMEYEDEEGGLISFTVTAKYDYLKIDAVEGNIAAEMKYSAFHTKDECDRSIVIDGLAQLQGEFYTYVRQGRILGRFTGICNTGNDQDHVLEAMIDGSSHNIGFDLLLHITEISSDVTGVIFIDNITYDVRDILGIGINQCE